MHTVKYPSILCKIHSFEQTHHCSLQDSISVGDKLLPAVDCSPSCASSVVSKAKTKKKKKKVMKIVSISLAAMDNIVDNLKNVKYS